MMPRRYIFRGTIAMVECTNSYRLWACHLPERAHRGIVTGCVLTSCVGVPDVRSMATSGQSHPDCREHFDISVQIGVSRWWRLGDVDGNSDERNQEPSNDRA